MHTQASDEELLARAYRAYFMAARKAGETRSEPSHAISGLEKFKKKEYIVLRNVKGILAVYRVRTDGILKRLVRWPAEIE